MVVVAASYYDFKPFTIRYDLTRSRTAVISISSLRIWSESACSLPRRAINRSNFSSWYAWSILWLSFMTMTHIAYYARNTELY